MCHYAIALALCHKPKILHNNALLYVVLFEAMSVTWYLFCTATRAPASTSSSAMSVCHKIRSDYDEDEKDDDDIYIMMQFCLSVTKNEHFLKRSVCQPWFHGFLWVLVGFHGFSRQFHVFFKVVSRIFSVGFYGFSR